MTFPYSTFLLAGSLSWEAIPFLRKRDGVSIFCSVCLGLFFEWASLVLASEVLWGQIVITSFTQIYLYKWWVHWGILQHIRSWRWAAKLCFCLYQEGPVFAWLQQFTINLEHRPRAGFQLMPETGCERYLVIRWTSQWKFGLVLLLKLLWLNHISQKSYRTQANSLTFTLFA